jgi:hypothetical protein
MEIITYGFGFWHRTDIWARGCCVFPARLPWISVATHIDHNASSSIHTFKKGRETEQTTIDISSLIHHIIVVVLYRDFFPRRGKAELA